MIASRYPSGPAESLNPYPGTVHTTHAGAIADVTLWSRILSPEEVEALYLCMKPAVPVDEFDREYFGKA